VSPPADLDARAAQRELVARHARQSGGAVHYDDGAALLVDLFSGKSVPVEWPRVAAVAERTNRETGRPYLVLQRDDGSQLVVADVGVAFPPVASGDALGSLPDAVCFRDLVTAEGQLTHFLLDHPDETPSGQHVLLFLFCLAVVEGARRAGFDVSPEERRLERVLGELEARRTGGG
jgi:hypothetical protein